MRSPRFAPAFVLSMAAHVGALALLVALDSLWVSRERRPRAPSRVSLVSAPPSPTVPERGPDPPPPEPPPPEPRDLAEREEIPVEIVSPTIAGGEPASILEEDPPAEELSLSLGDPHESVVALIERYRRGDFSDSTGLWQRAPEIEARELAFEMINASFRVLRPEIEAERFLEAYRRNFPYMR